MIRFLQPLMLALWVCGGVVLCETPGAAESPVEASEPPQANPYPLPDQGDHSEAANAKVGAPAVKQLQKEPPAPAPRRPREPASAPAPSTKPAAAPPPAADLSIGRWLDSARDLRLAAEAGEGIAHDVSGSVEAATFHLSEMSRQFDPLGFKEAFLTIQQQNEMIQRQQATIQRLLEAEIARLRHAAGEPPLSAATEPATVESNADPSEETKAAL